MLVVSLCHGLVSLGPAAFLFLFSFSCLVLSFPDHLQIEELSLLSIESDIPCAVQLGLDFVEETTIDLRGDDDEEKG